jgi:hypothetical protein
MGKGGTRRIESECGGIGGQEEMQGGNCWRRTVAGVVAVAVVAAHDDIVVLEVARAVLEVVEGGAELAGEG